MVARLILLEWLQFGRRKKGAEQSDLIQSIYSFGIGIRGALGVFGLCGGGAR